MCFTPHDLMKIANSSAVNCGPLSEMTCSVYPYLQNKEHKQSTVLFTVVLCIINTSGHFEYASTATRNIAPWNGPAKSMWLR